VKSRSRSRISPANKVDGLGSSLSHSASNIKCRNMERKGSVGMASRAYAAKTRFQQPSAATSLPALALVEVEVHPPALKDEMKITELKRSVPGLTLARRNSTNIVKVKKDVKDIKEDNNKKLLKSIKTSSISSKKINVQGKREQQGKSEVNGDRIFSKVTLDSDDNKEKGHVEEVLEKKEHVQSDIIKCNNENEQEGKVVR